MPIPVAIDIPIVEQVAVEIDGLANEAAWTQAQVVDKFITFRPQPGNTPGQTTSVKVMASKEALLLHFSANDENPNQ